MSCRVIFEGRSQFSVLWVSVPPIAQYVPRHYFHAFVKICGLLERTYVWEHFEVYYIPASEVLTCFIVGLSGILANNGIFQWSNKNNKKLSYIINHSWAFSPFFWHSVHVKITGFQKAIVYNYMGKFILKRKFSVQVTTPNKCGFILKLMTNVSHRGVSRHHSHYYGDLLIDSCKNF